MTATMAEDGLMPSRKARVQTAVYLRPDQADALRLLADAQDRPVAHLIRVAIDRLITAEAGV